MRYIKFTEQQNLGNYVLILCKHNNNNSDTYNNNTNNGSYHLFSAYYLSGIMLRAMNG